MNAVMTGYVGGWGHGSGCCPPRIPAPVSAIDLSILLQKPGATRASVMTELKATLSRLQPGELFTILSANGEQYPASTGGVSLTPESFREALRFAEQQYLRDLHTGE